MFEFELNILRFLLQPWESTIKILQCAGVNMTIAKQKQTAKCKQTHAVANREKTVQQPQTQGDHNTRLYLELPIL